MTVNQKFWLGVWLIGALWLWIVWSVMPVPEPAHPEFETPQQWHIALARIVQGKVL